MRFAFIEVWAPMRRALYLTHRWLGILGCVLFVLWFVSGLVMLHVRFPTLTQQERLQQLTAMDLGSIRVSPRDALERVGVVNPRSVVLEERGGEAGHLVWRILDQRGGHHVVSASNPSASNAPFSPADGRVVAQAFGKASARYIETKERDQWTMPNAGPFDKARPLHRFALDDAARTELYISAKTGEVVRDTNAYERGWTTFGTLLHYYTYGPIRQYPDFWRQLVLWTSGIAMFVAASGLIVGTLRVRIRRRYRSTASVTPYRGWMAWHHVLGLVGGITILTWVFSGWFSMGPNKWLSYQTPSTLPARFAQAQPVFLHGLESLQQMAASNQAVKAIEAGWYDGHPVWTLFDGAGSRRTVDAISGEPISVRREALLKATAAAYPSARVEDARLLTEADFYWYSRHAAPVLPVWRIKLADPASTWLHVDAVSGRLLTTSTSDSRLRRWLFNGLHSFDFPFFMKTPLWYLTIWALSLTGLAASVSGVVIGWRRLRRPGQSVEA
ncbi:MAG: PepSY domain-containing protein [Pseudomonadota bacterium]